MCQTQNPNSDDVPLNHKFIAGYPGYNWESTSQRRGGNTERKKLRSIEISQNSFFKV